MTQSYRTIKPVKTSYLGVPTVVSEWRKAGPDGLRVIQYQQDGHMWTKACTGNGMKGTFRLLETCGAQHGADATPEQVQDLIHRYLEV